MTGRSDSVPGTLRASTFGKQTQAAESRVGRARRERNKSSVTDPLPQLPEDRECGSWGGSREKEEAGWILNALSALSATNHENQRKALLRSPLVNEMHLEIPPSHGLLPYKNMPTSKQLLNQTKSKQKDNRPGPQHQ